MDKDRFKGTLKVVAGKVIGSHLDRRPGQGHHLGAAVHHRATGALYRRRLTPGGAAQVPEVEIIEAGG